jgi:hypothetical protein
VTDEVEEHDVNGCSTDKRINGFGAHYPFIRCPIR